MEKIEIQRRALKATTELPKFINAKKLVSEQDQFKHLSQDTIYRILRGELANLEVVNFLESQVEKFNND